MSRWQMTALRLLARLRRISSCWCGVEKENNGRDVWVQSGGGPGGEPRWPGARDQNESARLEGLFAHRDGKPEGLEGRDLDRNGAEGHGQRAALDEDVGAEARHARNAEGEVDFAVGLEIRPLPLGENAGDPAF